MTGTMRAGAAAGLLLLLWTAASGLDETPPAPAPSQPAATDRYPSSPVPLTTLPKTSAQPVPFNAGPARPSPLKPAATPAAPAAVTPAPAVLGYPQNPAAAPAPALGSELRGRIKEDERHFGDKSAEAKRAFERRQAEEYKEFAATLANKGFWERRRLTKEFKAAQAKRRKEFNDEQEAKRRTYEWRYP
jgi:hypothetical protein